MTKDALGEKIYEPEGIATETIQNATWRGKRHKIKNLSSVGYGITTSGLPPVELEPKEKNQGRIKFKKLKLKLN